MALWSRICVNEKAIGHVEAIRVAELPLNENRYNWVVEMYGLYKAKGTIEHNEKDGADGLLMKILWQAQSAKLSLGTDQTVQFLKGPDWVDF